MGAVGMVWAMEGMMMAARVAATPSLSIVCV